MISGLSNVHFQIFGVKYRISSDTDPEHTREVASYIDQKMREIASSTFEIRRAKVAVLVAINLADELFKIEEEGRQIDRISRERADQLTDSVNRIMQV